MNDMEERARRVLAIARDRHNPGSADAARVRAALRARLGAEPALLQAPLKAAPEARLLRKLLVAFGVGGGAGFAAGLYVAQAVAPAATTNLLEAPTSTRPMAVAASAARDTASAQGTAPPAVASEVHSPSAAVPEFATSAERSVAPASAAPRRKLVEPAVSALHSTQVQSPNGPHPLKAELDGLRRAQELLHQGQPAWALARLNELDRAPVGSVLLEERSATRAIAECLLGQRPTAQAREFERRFPRSAHLEQVRSSCSLAHQSGAPRAPVQSAQTETPASRHE